MIKSAITHPSVSSKVIQITSNGHHQCFAMFKCTRARTAVKWCVCPAVFIHRPPARAEAWHATRLLNTHIQHVFTTVSPTNYPALYEQLIRVLSWVPVVLKDEARLNLVELLDRCSLFSARLCVSGSCDSMLRARDCKHMRSDRATNSLKKSIDCNKTRIRMCMSLIWQLNTLFIQFRMLKLNIDFLCSTFKCVSDAASISH